MRDALNIRFEQQTVTVAMDEAAYLWALLGQALAVYHQEQKRPSPVRLAPADCTALIEPSPLRIVLRATGRNHPLVDIAFDIQQASQLVTALRESLRAAVDL